MNSEQFIWNRNSGFPVAHYEINSISTMKNIIFLCCLILLGYTAQAEYFTIKAYHVEIQVSENGYFDVREDITVLFDTLRRGIFRTIPLRYNIEGKKRKLVLEDIKVETWDFMASIENGQQVIRIGNPDIYIEWEQHYVISYRVKNGFLWTNDRPEFYWNLVGTEWDVPIESISYRITFPENLDIRHNEYFVYTGTRGAVEYDASIERNGNVFSGESKRVFNPGEGLTVAVLLPEGFIHKPSFLENLWNKNKLLPVPLVMIFLLFGVWRKKGANPVYNYTQSENHYPPEDISAAETGLFMDNQVNQRDIISLLPEWGEKGYVRVSGGSGELYIERKEHLPTNYPEYQQILFSGIFKKGDFILLSDLKYKMHSTVAKAGSVLRKYVRRQGWYDQTAYRWFHMGGMIVLFGLLIAAGILLMVLGGQIFTGILTILLGVGAFILHFLPPKRSEEGLALQDYLIGFRNFLKNPSQDRIRALLNEDERYFEKVYPYAVAFGLDKSLTKKFDPYMESAPYWFLFYVPYGTHVGSGRPTFSDFTTQFDTKNITSAFVSQPGSSGSGSSAFGGGGGFSGGGVGGGGGGSW